MARKALPPPRAEDNCAPSQARVAINGQLPADWTARRGSGAGGFGCLAWKFVIWAWIMGDCEPHENAVNDCKPPNNPPRDSDCPKVGNLNLIRWAI